MAKKVWDSPIDKNIPWDGNKETENLPVSGTRIEEFLKGTLNEKMGVLHYDVNNNRYLAFADKQTLEEYLEDPTKTNLVLGTFDASFNYEASIILSSPTYKAISVGTTGNYIDFTFDIKNKSGQSTGEDILCTYTFIKGSTKRVVKEKYRSGTSVHFNIDDYISEGTNRITVGIIGQNTLAATTIGITYQVVHLSIEDNMDISTVYNLLSNPYAVLPIEYTVEGNGTKTMEWYLDGTLLDFVQVEDEIVDPKGSRTKYIPLEGLSNGKHSIQYRTSVVLEGEKFYSSTLYRDIIVYDGSSINPIIAIAAVIPSGYAPSEDGILNIRGINQYEPFDIQLSVYNPSSAATTEAAIYLDNQLQATLNTHNGDVLTYSIISSSHGVKSLRIEAGVTTYEAQINISQSSINLVEITENLQLDFRAANKSNSDADKDMWSYGSYSGTFTGFNWNETSGWTNKRLRIPSGASLNINISPLSPDPVSTGKTLEFEFSTVNVSDDNTILCDLRNSSGVGILITASKVSLTSAEGKELVTEYKSEENIRVAFVINKRSGSVNKGMAFVYVNGIVSGSVNFSTTDLFTSTTQFSIQGSDEATVLLKDLRFYNSALSSDQILNNYILYRDTASEMVRVYNRNDVYEEGTVKFSLDALNAQLPVMVFTGNIPELEATSDKDYTIDVDIEYTNLQDPSLNFTMKNGKLRLQGTSSLGYPKKNYRFYSNKSDATVFLDSDGMALPNRKYSFKKGAQPVDCWCLKADFAESSGTHNTGIARLWGDVLPNVILDGEYVCRTNAQKAALEAGYPYDVRTTIDGFPIIVAYRLKAEDDPILIGKYNFNNDKSTESVFGFCDIPGFDNSKVQCWEVLNNGDQLALFQTTENWDTTIDLASGKKRWEQAYEARYPDKNKDTTYLKAFCDWVVSTKDNVAKFKTEKWQHCNVYMMAAYYVYAIRHGAVDQIVKNSMLTTEDGQHFFWILYDNDTINGLRNDGRLKYPPTIDRQSLDADFTETVYAYAGHDSVLWNNMEADDEFMNIVIRIDNALYSAGLTYNNVINMFDVEQSSKWCERIYNLDAQYKYIGPFTDQGLNYLELLQGSRQSHRRWWLSRRFNLIDSKFVSGEYKAKGVELKLVGCPANTQFKVTAGYNMNYGYGINNDPIEYGISLNEGESHNFSTPNRVLNIGDPLNIYAAINIQELDFSNFTPYLSQINIGSVYSETLGTKLKKLILGVDVSSDTRRNISVGDISGLPSAKRLEYLDIGGYEGIESLNLSDNAFLTTLKAYGSGLTGVTFAEGGAISSVQLPETMQALVLKNLPYLSTSGLNIAEKGKNLRVITIQNCAKLRSIANFIFDWYDNKVSNDAETSLTLTNILWTNIDVEKLIVLGNIKFTGGTLSLKGKIYLTSCTEEQANRLVEIFGTKAFDKENELYISAPDAIYLTGPDSINAGETAQFYATVFSEYKGTVTYSISGSSYASIDQNGLVTTKRFTSSTYTCTVTARHTPTQGRVVTVTKTFTLNGLTNIVNVNINGDSVLGVESKTYTMSIIPSVVTVKYTVSWTLSGDAYTQGLVKMVSQDSNKCILQGTPSSSSVNCTLTCKVTDEFNYTISVNKTITVLEEGLIITNSTHPNTLSKLYNAGMIDSPSKMYDYEAASITDLGTVINNVTESLDWLAYTSITSFGSGGSYSGSLYGCNPRGSTIRLPDTVTSINLPFGFSQGSTGTVIIPKSVTEVTGGGFLTHFSNHPTTEDKTFIFVDSDNEIIKSSDDGQMLLSKNGDTVYGIASDKSGDIVIPEGVKTIAKQQLYKCTSIRLPSSLENFGGFELVGSTYLTHIYIDTPTPTPFEGFTGSGFSYALFDLLPSVNIIISNAWDYIPSYFIRYEDYFYNSYLSKVLSLTILNNVKVIKEGAIRNLHYKWFNTLPNNTLVIPDTVEVLENEAIIFYDSSAPSTYEDVILKIYIGKSLRGFSTIWSSLSDRGTQWIKDISISEDNTNFKYINGCLLSNDHTKLISVFTNSTSVSIPDTVTEIGENSLVGVIKRSSTDNLRTVTDIYIPNGVRKIGDYAFAHQDTNIKNTLLNIHGMTSDLVSLEEVGRSAFVGVQGETTISLPTSLNKIGSYAFYNCLSLKGSIIITTDLISAGLFSSSNIAANCGIEHVEFEEGITDLPGNVCYNWGNLRTVKLPSTLSTIGYSFCSGCKLLESLEFPASLTSISANSFLSSCLALKTLIFKSTKAPYFIGSTSYCFGSSSSSYTGYNTYNTGENTLYVPANSTGYTTGVWLDPLQNILKCGFTLSATL